MRTLIFLPTVVSIVAIGFVWRWVLNDDAGLSELGAVGWRAMAEPAELAAGRRRGRSRWIVIVSVWRGIGFCLVLYLAALGNIPESLYEAAELDGASRWSASCAT